MSEVLAPQVLDRGIVDGDLGYVGHVDSTKDELGNIFGAFVQERVKSRPGLLIRRRQGGTGQWSDVHWFPPDEGKFGHCAVECKGRHLVVLASRQNLVTGEVRVHEYIILDVCEVLVP